MCTNCPICGTFNFVPIFDRFLIAFVLASWVYSQVHAIEFSTTFQADKFASRFACGLCSSVGSRIRNHVATLVC